MMDAISAADPGMRVSSASKRAEISREQFLKILVTELTTQDPINPLDNAQFLQQLVGLQTLEQTSALTDALQSFENFLQMSSSTALIGRLVEGVDEGGKEARGVVEKVLMVKGKVFLQVGEHRLPVTGVQEIL